MNVIFASAVQYPARLTAATQRNNLPRERKDGYAQARAACGEPLSRPSMRHLQLGLPQQAKLFAFSHHARDSCLETTF